MPVFTQYARAMTPLTGNEVLLAAQEQNGTMASVTVTSGDVANLAGALVLNFQTVSAMIASPPFFLGVPLIAHVAGYNVPNDSGGGLFYWDPLSTATPDNVVTFQVTGAAEGRWIRILQDDATINVMMAGAWGDGVHDDTNAIQAAINYLVVRGGGAPGLNTNTSGGRIVIQNFGKPYLISKQITYYSYIHIIGEGFPTIKLMPNSGTSVLESLNFHGNIYPTPVGGGIHDVWIDGLILDGNSANQPLNTSGGATDPTLTQNGLSFYGYGWCKFSNLIIMNVKGDFITVGGGQGSGEPGQFAPRMMDIIGVGAGCHGILNVNLHDLVSENILLVNCSQNQDGGYYGFWNKTSGRHSEIHVWTNNFDSTVVNFPAYGLRSEGFSEYVNCHFESCKQSVLLDGPYDVLTQCSFYNPAKTYVANTAFVDFNSHHCSLVNCKLDAKIDYTQPSGSPNAASMYAFALLSSGANNNTVAPFIAKNFDQVGLLNIVADGGNDRFLGTGAVETNTNGNTYGNATVFSGIEKLSPTTIIEYNQTGVVPYSFHTGALLGYEQNAKNFARLVRLKAISVDGAPARMTMDGQAANFFNTLGLQDSSAMLLAVEMVAIGSNGASAIFTGGKQYLVKRGTGASSIFIVGVSGSTALTMGDNNGTVTGWGVTLAADKTLGSVDIECIGAPGMTVTFDAIVRCSVGG